MYLFVLKYRKIEKHNNSANQMNMGHDLKLMVKDPKHPKFSLEIPPSKKS